MNLWGLELAWMVSDPRLGWIVAIVSLAVLAFVLITRGRLGSRRKPGGSAEANPFSDRGKLDRVRVMCALGRIAEVRGLPELFQAVVRAMGEEFGLERAVLRVFNPHAKLFEARAFHGCHDELVGRLSTTDVPFDLYAFVTSRAGTVGNSFRVRHDDHLWPDRLHPDDPQDLLVVPLRDGEGHVAGYICASTLGSRSVLDDTVVFYLEVLAQYAVSALAQARLRSTLQRRDVEYSIVTEQLREWQSTRDNFVANVSHELRTPLTSIRAYAETLQRSHEEMDGDTANEFVDVILHEAQRLTRAFDDLLDVARHPGGVDQAIHGKFDVTALIDRTASEVVSRFDKAGLELHVAVPDQPVEIHGDESSIRQLLLNLLDNAAKFSAEGSRVDVRLETRGGLAQIEVRDLGIGIPEGELERIFERFYQVDGTATRAFGGQGLGLAICREIVSRHHGHIWAENRPDGGARVVATLPLRGLVLRRSRGDLSADPGERQQWEAFLQLSISFISEMLQARIASIMLVDRDEDVLRIEAAVGLSQDVVEGVIVGRGESVAGRVWKDATSLLVPDLDADERFCELGNEVTYDHRGLLSVPLWCDGGVVGVINVNNHVDERAFDDDDRLLLEALAERIAAGLESFERYRSGYRRLASVESGVRALLEVGRERRSELRELLIRLGLETGRRLELDEETLRALAYALRTYDLGLARISDQIVRKVSPLSAEERGHIESHVQLGAELMSDLEPSTNVRNIILHHHENHDGSGYPEGLSGEAIPLAARIVRLVDALAALLHDRPFRPALGPQEALGAVEKDIGRSFCPRVAPVFLALVRESKRALISAQSRSVPEGSDREPELVEVQPVQQ